MIENMISVYPNSRKCKMIVVTDIAKMTIYVIDVNSFHSRCNLEYVLFLSSFLLKDFKSFFKIAMFFELNSPIENLYLIPSTYSDCSSETKMQLLLKGNASFCWQNAVWMLSSDFLSLNERSVILGDKRKREGYRTAMLLAQWVYQDDSSSSSTELRPQ